jgi:hypothetical protein
MALFRDVGAGSGNERLEDAVDRGVSAAEWENLNERVLAKNGKP